VENKKRGAPFLRRITVKKVGTNYGHEGSFCLLSSPFVPPPFSSSFPPLNGFHLMGGGIAMVLLSLLLSWRSGNNDE